MDRRCVGCDKPVVGRRPNATYCAPKCGKRIRQRSYDRRHILERRKVVRRSSVTARMCASCQLPLATGNGNTRRHPECQRAWLNQKRRGHRSNGAWTNGPIQRERTVVPSRQSSYLAKILDQHRPCRECGELTMPRTGKPLVCIVCRGELDG